MISINKIINYLKTINKIKFIVLMSIFTILLNILVSVLVKFIVSDNSVFGTFELSIKELISGIIICPLLETLIFQKFIYYICIDSNKKISDITYILISSLCFALPHSIYNIWYAIGTFFIGFNLAFSYVVYAKKNDTPILVTTIIHASTNAYVYIFAMIKYFLL